MNEVYHAQREDRDLLFIMHLSQLLSLISGIGGLVAPLIIWAIKKDEIINMDKQGKDVINFQLTLLIASIVSFILCFVLIGFILLPVILIIGIVIPIIQAINAKNGAPVSYPLAIRFL